jgi:hypothetical protein
MIPLVEVVVLLLALIVGAVIIMIIGALIFLLPAAIIALVVWYLSHSTSLAGLAFLLFALISLLKKR